MTEKHRREAIKRYYYSDDPVCFPMAVDGVLTNKDLRWQDYEHYVQMVKAFYKLPEHTKEGIQSFFREYSMYIGIKIQLEMIGSLELFMHKLRFDFNKGNGVIVTVKDPENYDHSLIVKGEQSVGEIEVIDSIAVKPYCTTSDVLFKKLISNNYNYYSVTNGIRNTIFQLLHK